MQEKMREAAIKRTKQAVEDSRKVTRLEFIKLVTFLAEKRCVYMFLSWSYVHFLFFLLIKF